MWVVVFRWDACSCESSVCDRGSVHSNCPPVVLFARQVWSKTGGGPWWAPPAFRSRSLPQSKGDGARDSRTLWPAQSKPCRSVAKRRRRIHVSEPLTLEFCGFSLVSHIRNIRLQRSVKGVDLEDTPNMAGFSTFISQPQVALNSRPSVSLPLVEFWTHRELPVPTSLIIRGLLYHVRHICSMVPACT